MSGASRKWDVVVLGGINTDFVIRSQTLPMPGQTVVGETFYTGPGGKGANQCVAAARLGARVAFVSRVGRDSRGKEAVQGLRDNKVNVRHVTVDPRTPTGAAIVSVGANGEKQITAAPGANLKLRLKDVRHAESLIASAAVLLMQLETPLECVLLAARLAKKHGTKVILDPAPPKKLPAELFPLLSIIRPNSDEAEHLAGIKVTNRQTARKAARVLLDRGVEAVAMESGDGGDLLITRDEEHFFPRLKVKVVDATGAGDAFAGALAAGIAEGLSLKDAGALANATAALSTTKIGAQEALPARKEVEQLLRRGKRPPQ